MLRPIAIGFILVMSCQPGEVRDTAATSSAFDPTQPRGSYAVGSCAHDPCSTGAHLSSSCDACVGNVCAKDSYCCKTKWDQQCVNEVGTYCGSSCNGGGVGGGGGGNPDLGTSGGGSCAHAICSAGAKLTASCDPCAQQICSADSYCCSTKWDAQCVNEVASVCNQSCTGGGGGGGGGGNPDMATGGGGGPGTLFKFAVFGDCRPPNLEGTSHYPSAIIGGIFSLAQSHAAQFVVGTGDYVFSNTASGVSAQLALFQQAMANYSAGPVYLTMGNHECSGYTASNCPNLNETPNVQQFLKLLPAGVSKPYYRIDVATPFGTAKLVFVAANAWDSTQQSWLQTQLADPTAYTFVMRHEPPADTQAPGVGPSESVIKQYPLTLELLGHTHEYKHLSANYVISGNAGAPLQSGSGSSYGMLLVEQQANGNVTVTEIDEASGNVVDTFNLTPGGQPAP